MNMSKKEKRKMDKRKRWPLNLVCGFLAIGFGAVFIGESISLALMAGRNLQAVSEGLLILLSIGWFAIDLGSLILIEQPMGERRPERVRHYTVYGRTVLAVTFVIIIIMYAFSNVWWVYLLAVIGSQQALKLAVRLFTARKPIW